MKLISDKTKIVNYRDNVLFNVETENGYCADFAEHRLKIIDRIESLINQAIEDDDDIKLLVKSYLEMDVWGSPYTIANTLAESQQMAAALTPLKERYHQQGMAQTHLMAVNEIPSENKFTDKEEKKNKELFEEMTLILYLETLQNRFLENC